MHWILLILNVSSVTLGRRVGADDDDVQISGEPSKHSL